VDGVQPSMLLEFMPGMPGMRPPKHHEHITGYIHVWLLSKGNLMSIIKPLHLSQKPMRRAATSFTPTINPSKSVVRLPGLLKIPFNGVGLPQKASMAHPATHVGVAGPLALLNCHSFFCSFRETRSLIGDMKRVCLLENGRHASEQKKQIGK
jgi:hypothetical protein